jgi:hypothetical protein
MDTEPTPRHFVPSGDNDCMDCWWGNKATWRSDDGYPFCEQCAHTIYSTECGFANIKPLSYEAWVAANRPHGPEHDIYEYTDTDGELDLGDATV